MTEPVNPVSSPEIGFNLTYPMVVDAVVRYIERKHKIRLRENSMIAAISVTPMFDRSDDLEGVVLTVRLSDHIIGLLEDNSTNGDPDQGIERIEEDREGDQ
jgi:hypothetical protein